MSPHCVQGPEKVHPRRKKVHMPPMEISSNFQGMDYIGQKIDLWAPGPQDPADSTDGARTLAIIMSAGSWGPSRGPEESHPSCFGSLAQIHLRAALLAMGHWAKKLG